MLLNCAGTAQKESTPTILTQPENRKVAANTTATFQVQATGDPVPSYQWRKNGTPVDGATASAYTVVSAATDDNDAAFDVVVSNAEGSVTSKPAYLNVYGATVAPVVNQEPESLSLKAGGSAEFTVNASGTSPLYYQWLKNGQALDGATKATLPLSPVNKTDSGAVFEVIIYNAVNKVLSQAATLSVTD